MTETKQKITLSDVVGFTFGLLFIASLIFVGFWAREEVLVRKADVAQAMSESAEIDRQYALKAACSELEHKYILATGIDPLRVAAHVIHGECIVSETHYEYEYDADRRAFVSSRQVPVSRETIERRWAEFKKGN